MFSSVLKGRMLHCTWSENSSRSGRVSKSCFPLTQYKLLYTVLYYTFTPTPPWPRLPPVPDTPRHPPGLPRSELPNHFLDIKTVLSPLRPDPARWHYNFLTQKRQHSTHTIVQFVMKYPTKYWPNSLHRTPTTNPLHRMRANTHSLHQPRTDYNPLHQPFTQLGALLLRYCMLHVELALPSGVSWYWPSSITPSVERTFIIRRALSSRLTSLHQSRTNNLLHYNCNRTS